MGVTTERRRKHSPSVMQGLIMPEHRPHTLEEYAQDHFRLVYRFIALLAVSDPTVSIEKTGYRIRALSKTKFGSDQKVRDWIQQNTKGLISEERDLSK